VKGYFHCPSTLSLAPVLARQRWRRKIYTIFRFGESNPYKF